jgi:hypothetical protein
MKNLKLYDPENKPHFLLMELIQEVNKRVKNMRFEYDGGDRVECYKEWEYVGELGYAYHERAGNKLFHVKSDKYIENHKSPYHSKQSKHMRQIVKECVRVFKNTESSEIAKKIVDATKNSVENIVDAHEDAIYYDRWIPEIYVNVNYSQALLERCVEGRPLPKPDNLTDELLSKMRDKLHAHKVASGLWEEVKNKEGYYVRIENDGTYNVVDLADSSELLISTQDFDELPEIMKDKLTLLKMQNNETCVINTGIKARDYLLYVSKASMDHLV